MKYLARNGDDQCPSLFVPTHAQAHDMLSLPLFPITSAALWTDACLSASVVYRCELLINAPLLIRIESRSRRCQLQQRKAAASLPVLRRPLTAGRFSLSTRRRPRTSRSILCGMPLLACRIPASPISVSLATAFHLLERMTLDCEMQQPHFDIIKPLYDGRRSCKWDACEPSVSRPSVKHRGIINGFPGSFTGWGSGQGLIVITDLEILIRGGFSALIATCKPSALAATRRWLGLKLEAQETN